MISPAFSAQQSAALRDWLDSAQCPQVVRDMVEAALREPPESQLERAAVARAAEQLEEARGVIDRLSMLVQQQRATIASLKSVIADALDEVGYYEHSAAPLRAALERATEGLR